MKLLNHSKLWVSGLLVAFLVMLTSVVFWRVDLAAEEDCWRTLHETAANIDSQLNSWMQSSQNALEGLGKMLDGQPNLRDPKVFSMIQSAKVGDLSAPVQLWFPDGLVIAEPPYNAAPSEKTRKAYIDKVKAQPYISQVIDHPQKKGERAFELFRPIKQGSHILGMLVAIIDIAQLKNAFQVTAYEGATQSLLLDRRDEQIVYYTAFDMFPIRTLSELETPMSRDGVDFSGWKKKLLNGESLTLAFTAGYSPNTQFMIARPSQVPDWTLEIVVDGAQAFKEVHQIRRIFTFFFIIEFLGLGLYLFWLWRESRRELRLKIAEEKQRSEALIDVFTENYTVLYAYDLEKDEFDLRTCDKAFLEINEGVFAQGSGSKSFAYFIDNYVHPDDRATVREACSIDYIRHRLAHSRNFRITLRALANERYLYFDQVIAKMGEVDDPVTKVAVGYLLVDDEVSAQKEREQQDKMRNELLDILGSDYFALYYMNLVEKRYENYALTTKLEQETGKDIRNGQTLKELYAQFVQHLVHPEDREKIADAIDDDVIRERLAHQKNWTAIFRRNFDGEYFYIQMKVAKAEPVDEEPVNVAVAFLPVDSEVRARLQADEERKRQLLLLDGLSREYHSVWLINAATGEMHMHRTSEGGSTISAAVQLFEENPHYSDAMEQYIERFVEEEDRERVRDDVQLLALEQKTPDDGIYTVSYKRSLEEGGFDYHQMAFARAQGSQEGNSFVLAYRDVNAQMKEELEKQAKLSQALTMQLRARDQLEQNAKIIEALASEYSSVYYIDLETEELIPYTMTGQAESKFGAIFKSGITYSEAFKLYVNDLIYAADRDMMLRSGSVSNIRMQLLHQRSFVTTYRGIEEGQPHFCEMTFVKFNDEEVEPKAVALGFADKDEEIIRRFILDKLEDEYVGIYMVDLVHDSFRSYKSPLTKGEVSVYGNCWSKVIELFAQRCTEITRPVLWDLASIEFLQRELTQNDRREYIYRKQTGVRPWQRVVLQVIERENTENKLLAGLPQMVIATFTELDDAAAENMELQVKMRQNRQIIETLSSEYASVYFVDLKTEQITPYSMSKVAFKEEDRFFQGGQTYSEALKSYVDHVVFESDRSQILDSVSTTNLLRQLAHAKNFVATYRSIENDEPHFCEMKFIKLEDVDQPPTAMVIAFADRDQEICGRFVFEKLRTEYASIYLVDLENDSYRNIQTSVLKGFEGYKRGCYSRDLSVYAQLVGPDFKEEWSKLCRPECIRTFLGEADRREFIYNMPKAEQPWRRCVFQVVSRKEGVPTMMIVSFMAIDADRAEKLDLDAKIATQKKALEEQQQLLEKALSRAEAASRAKTTFLSNMSHDIRTPMNAIIGFTNLAIANVADSEKTLGYLEKTATSSQHLLSLINDILDMSRIESGKIQLEEMDCSLGEIMHDVSVIILGQAQAKHQNLYLDSFNVRDEFVLCDKLRLHQVLINLLSNSVKFTPVGGDVRLNIRQLHTPDRALGIGLYEFQVRDSGIGMSDSFVKHIFEPFERERTSTISKTQGTGLGMSITKSIIDMMGGTIDVKSAQGQGSEFTIRLKMKLQPDKLQVEPIDAFDGARVLLIDSDAPGRRSAITLFAGLGLRTETAESLEQALDLCAAQGDENPYRIVVLVWHLSSGDVLAALRQLKLHLKPETLLWTASAYDKEVIEKEAREIGVTAFLSKPFFYSEIYTALARESGLAVEQQEASGDEIDFTGKRILLVEDNELNREIAEEMLSDHGLIVDTAEDGAEAVEKVKASKPGTYDAILMDIQMPIMDGYEATRRIRALENPSLSQIPIIAITANAFAEDRQAVLDAGMNDHVAKPIDFDLLAELLRKYFN